jgi:hypothetical protein
MSNPRYNPTFKNPPVSLTPAKPGVVPEELKQLDGAALCATTPGENQIPPAAGGQTFPAKPKPGEGIEQTEFNLHGDGCLAKYDENPGKAPTQRVVDGAGRVFCIARNSEVADLICNALNFMHTATVKILIEQQEAARKAQESAGQGGIIDPNLGGNIILPPGSNN